MKLDILLVSIPIIESNPYNPPAGIFTLRPWLEQNGYTVACIDGNRVGNDIYKMVAEIRKYDFDWLGLSLLSEHEQKLAQNIAMNFDKVIFGGTGVTSAFRSRWKHQMHPGTVHMVNGEGEYALIELLKGNLDYPGINDNPPQQILDISQFPAPDYRGYDYKNATITGSRGCVRSCSFCNVPTIWKKYVYVDGKVLANHIVSIAENNPTIKEVSFSDSLVNGSDTEFYKMCNELIRVGTPLPWYGQFIVKKRKREYFQMIVDSGCRFLIVGVESLSENVRWHMNKKFTDETLYFNIDTLLDCGLKKMALMMIVGYPTETEEDFMKVIPFLKRYYDQRDRITIAVALMGIIGGTPISNLYHGDGMKYENGLNTFEERLKRYFMFIYFLDHFDYPEDETRQPRLQHMKDRVGEELFYMTRLEAIEEAQAILNESS